MISFKQFIQEMAAPAEHLEEGKFQKAVAGALIAGAAIGAVGGAKIADQHISQNAQSRTTISQGKRMVSAQKWAKERRVEKATKAALSKPGERIPAEVPKNARSFLDAIEHTRDLDHSMAATIQHYNPKGDDYMKTSRGRVVDPKEYQAGKTPNVKYSGGSKFSMNFKTMPDPVVNPYADIKMSGANEEPPNLIGKPQVRKKK